MRILFTVTIHALARSIPKLNMTAMTGIARQFCMSVKQGKIRMVVLKTVRVQWNAVEVPALVVLVTTPARRSGSRRGSPVVSHTLDAIRCDGFVTFEAQCVLCTLVETGMAGFAVFFFVCVCFDQGPRHQDHGFDVQFLAEHRLDEQ